MEPNIESEAALQWGAVMAWFDALPLGFQILYLVLSIVITVAVFTLVYYLLKAIFWLVYQVIKFHIFLVIFITYNVLEAFLIAPIELIFQNKHISEIWGEYKKNMKNVALAFYGTKKTEIPQTAQTTPVAPAYATTMMVMPVSALPAAMAVAAAAPTVKVIQAKVPKAEFAEPLVYHCAACGEKFSPLMSQLLSQKHQAFCEHCGQGYRSEGNVPYPVQV